MKTLINILFVGFIFLGCSSKEYYEPDFEKIEYISGEEHTLQNLEAPIKTFNRYGATLTNQTVVLSGGLKDKKLKDGFNFINEIDDTMISADNDGKILVGDTELNLDKVVVAASYKDNLLAIVFVDNSIALYDMSKKQMLFKEYYKESLANDIRISNPIFMSDIVLYPTLDGKAIVVSLIDPKILRTIIVDSSTKFNNVSFFSIVNNSLIAATANQIISLNASSLISKDFEIRDIIKKDNYIYIATLDGQILKLDSALNVLAKTKFKYAKVYSLGINDKFLYALESQSYLIQLDHDLKNEKVFSFKFKNDAKSVILGDRVYFQQTKLDKQNTQFYKEDYYIVLP